MVACRCRVRLSSADQRLRDVGLWLDLGRPADPVAEALADVVLPLVDANQSVWKEPLPDCCFVG
ncbi:MAG: hypothetical protein JWO62_2532 [Acidimicrobiaceae bacterium]|nr:hypothetical protein [Acidimicrobiaceae bacterium]